MNVYQKMLIDAFDPEVHYQYTWQEIVGFMIWLIIEYYIKFLGLGLIIASGICLYAYFNDSCLDGLYPTISQNITENIGEGK